MVIKNSEIRLRAKVEVTPPSLPTQEPRGSLCRYVRASVCAWVEKTTEFVQAAATGYFYAKMNKEQFYFTMTLLSQIGRRGKCS